MNKQVILKIYGRVQGVFFRVGVQEKARELGLTGWVKNVENGTIKILAQGEETKLKELINWCSTGPRLAKVERVDVKWKEANSQFKDFEIMY